LTSCLLNSLPLYTKKREDYAIDLEQFHDLIRQMDDHKSMLEKKVKEKKAELAKTNDQLEKCSNEVDELKRTIATQKLSVDDVQKIESEIKGIHEALDRTAAVKEQRRKNVTAHEEELIKFCYTVDSVVTSFNTKLIDLLEVPELVSILKNKKLSFNRDNLLLDDQREILGADIQQQVQPLILRYQDDYVERLSKGKEQYQDEMDEMEATIERNKVVLEELSVLRDKKIKMEQTLSSEVEIASATLAVRQRELDTIERKVTSLRDPVALEEQLATYDRQCAELESLRIDQQEENIAKKKSVVEEINTACTAMKDYEDKLQETMKTAANHWNSKRETLHSLKITSSIE
jgi:kinetochore protein NDC80